jgi:hypothetical protein
MKIAQSQVPAPGDLVLDHVAHWVADLDAAARVLQAIGLAVTPVSAQRVGGKAAGTSNRCVMLERGYLEFLAGRPERGLQLACFGTPDAQGEHRRLAAHGFKPQPLVDLSRKISATKIARFKVVRPAPGSMPEGRIQYVQHLTPQHVWRTGFINPLRLEGLYVKALNPEKAAARWARFTGTLPQRTQDGVRVDTARGWVLIARRFPWKTPAAPALAGYRLGCRQPRALAARLRKAGIEVNKFGRGHAAVLPAALGGAWVFG